MSQLDDIQKQIDELLEQKKQLLIQERAPIIAELKKKIEEFGITAVELGFKKVKAGKPAKTELTEETAKYKGPNGELWAGGKGARPLWVKSIEANGESVEKYLIKR